MVQASALEEIDGALKQEYTVRRRMLIERAKVTLQSFMWADKLQKSQELKQPAQAAAEHGEALMHNQPAVSLEDVFRAKQGVTALFSHILLSFVMFCCVRVLFASYLHECSRLQDQHIKSLLVSLFQVNAHAALTAVCTWMGLSPKVGGLRMV